MMRFRSIWVALAFAANAALTGCASVDPIQGQEALTHAIPCCSSLSEVPSVPFDEVRDQIVYLDPSRPVVDLPSGKTFALLVELPEDRKFSRLVINSYYASYSVHPFSGRHTTRIVYPTVSILNSARKVVRVIPKFEFSFTRETWSEPTRLTTTITLSPDQDAEKYVAIYTTAEAIAYKSNYTGQGTTGVMTGGVPVIVPTFVKRTALGSAVGGIKLTALSE